MFTPNAFAKHKNVNEDEGMRTCVTKYKIKYKQGNLFRLKTNGERSFRYAAARIWNGLPQHMRSVTTVYSFKKSLKIPKDSTIHSEPEMMYKSKKKDMTNT